MTELEINKNNNLKKNRSFYCENKELHGICSMEPQLSSITFVKHNKIKSFTRITGIQCRDFISCPIMEFN